MQIHLGPTEHLDHPESLLGGEGLRSRLHSCMERQKYRQHGAREFDTHRTRLDDPPRRGMTANRIRF